MAYSVPPLPYAYDALEPHIDKATMEFHHDKHHQAYVDKVNAALEGTALADAPIEDVLKDLGQVPQDKRGAVKNNGGGHYNHSLFWESMSPDGGGEPSGALGDAIASAFGSFADFKAKVKETGVNQFGSGWSWLVLDGGNLAVVGSANQDNPISDGKTPLLGVDVWEHAYYLKYQNRRPDYLEAWWNTVDWSKVAERFAAAQGSSLCRCRRRFQLRLKRRPATGETASSSGAVAAGVNIDSSTASAASSFAAAAASKAAIRSGVICVASSLAASQARASAAATSSRWTVLPAA